MDRRDSAIGFDLPQKDLREEGVELASCIGFDLLLDLLQGESQAVRSVGNHGIKGIGQGDDPGKQGDGIPCQPIGIPVPVPPFMVMTNRRSNGVGESQGFDEVNAFHRVKPNIQAFLFAEFGFLQEPVAQPNLADVVEQGGNLQVFLLSGGKAEFLGDQVRIDRDPFGVPIGVGFLALQDVNKNLRKSR